MEIEVVGGGALVAFVGDGRRIETEPDGDKLAVADDLAGADDFGTAAKLDACGADGCAACTADGEVTSGRVDDDVPLVELQAAANASTRPEQAATPRRIFITMLD